MPTVAGLPLFSIIVPTYNRPDLLAEALDSVRQQTIEDFECVVVNDGGQPPELPEDDDDRFRLVEKENGGFPSALNAGLAEARGQIVAFLDDDDAFTPKRLELGLQGLATAPLTFCWRARPETGVGRYDRLLNGWVHDVIIDRGSPLLGQTTVLKDRAPSFNNSLRYASDTDWLLRATKEMRVSTVPEVGLLFRQNHPTRKSHDIHKRLESREQLYELHKEYLATHRKAAARFHSRTGLFLSAAGQTRQARHQLWRGVALRPTPRVVFRWLRAVVSSGPLSSVCRWQPTPPKGKMNKYANGQRMSLLDPEELLRARYEREKQRLNEKYARSRSPLVRWRRGVAMRWLRIRVFVRDRSIANWARKHD